ncbi:head assembly [uncultured phage_MedDCM-OCT-S39-C11]|uniref:Capsid assembly protein n=1 Tax=uncultured phage_MedDCM-OCT-S39-C11 TaxID=2740805 RepID=A0A6S4PEG2_9CAUD|nr:head assembly [uncultured phage_MedDCM-OCT-S39-C11]BAQ94488.1 hypothetical protein [uncultured phage_MedDCM-OCT-S39-C11]
MAVIETGQDNTVDQGAVEEQAKIDQARADLYDEAAGNEPGEPEGSLILGKYKSQSDLVDAYKNLQRENERLRGGEVEEAEEEPEAQQEEPENQLTSEDATRIRDNMFDQVGGADKYQALMGWASQNLNESRAESFNEALNSGNEGAILAQLKGIQYDHMMATGYEPKLTGGRAPTQDVRGFASEAQVVAAMQDPRYGSDPAYVKEVEQRIAASNVFNQR